MIGRRAAFFSGLDGYAADRADQVGDRVGVRQERRVVALEAVRGARVRRHRLLRRDRDRVVAVADDVGRGHVAPGHRAHGLHEGGDGVRAQARGGGVGDLRRARVVEDLLRARHAHRLAVGVRDLPRGRRAAGDVGERFALVEHEGREVDEVAHAVGAGGRLGDDDAAVGVTDERPCRPRCRRAPRARRARRRTGRRPRPRSAGRPPPTARPSPLRRLTTSSQHQAPCQAPWTSTTVDCSDMARILWSRSTAPPTARR